MVDLERVERAAFRSLWQHVPADVVSEQGIASAEVGGATCVVFRNAPTTMLNRALGLGIDRPATPSDVDSIVSFFAEHRVRFAIPVAPDAQPSSLEDMLGERGLEPGYAWMKFSRGTEDVAEVESELEIAEIGADRGENFGAVVAEAFGLPPQLARLWGGIAGVNGWHCFVGYAAGEPAAAGSLYVEGRAAWLGVAGTRPAFRGRGGQGAILAARLAAAKRLGVTIVATETGERSPERPSASYRNILRAGFEEAYLRPNYEREAIAAR